MRLTTILFALGLVTLLLGCPTTNDDTDDDDSAADDDTGDDDTGDDDTGDDDTGDPTGSTCAEILVDAQGSEDGLYTLTLTDQSTVEVYCDMAGGGWTLAFVSNRTATDKLRFSEFLAGAGVGSLGDNEQQYALANYTSLHHRPGIEIRLTWLCGEDHGAADVTADPAMLNSGNAVWADDRTADDLVASDGSFHNQFTNFSWDGDQCWSGQVREDYLYGFGIGNGNEYGQYVGWFSCADCFSGDTVSSAISDGAADNVPGTLAGWIR